MGILGFPTKRTRAMWSRGSFGAVKLQGESGFVKPSSRDVICPEARKLMALSSSCVWASHHSCLSSSPALGEDLPQHPASIKHHEEVSEEQSGQVGVAERRECGWKQASER